METAQVISINPGIKTAGALHEEALAASSLSRRLLATAAQTPQLSETFNFITGVDDKTEVSYKLTSARVLGGLALTAMSLSFFIQDGISALGIVQFALGLSMIAGLFTRMMGVAVAIWGIVTSLSMGLADQPILFTALAGAVAAIFGPGRLSLDFALRRRLLRLKHRAADRRARRVSADSYKAFHYAG